MAQRDVTKLPQWVQRLLKQKDREIERLTALMQRSSEVVQVGTDFVLPMSEIAYIDQLDREKDVCRVVLKDGKSFSVSNCKATVERFIVYTKNRGRQ